MDFPKEAEKTFKKLMDHSLVTKKKEDVIKECEAILETSLRRCWDEAVKEAAKLADYWYPKRQGDALKDEILSLKSGAGKDE